MRDSTIIYRSFWEAIKQLPVEQQAEAWNALFSYSLDFKPVEMSPLVNMVFTLIKPQLDANIKRYQVGVQNGSKGAEHGKKGGRPAITKPVENPQKTPKEPPANPHHNPQKTLTKPPNVNDNDNHNENENENQNADLTLKNFSDETAETKTEGTAEKANARTGTEKPVKQKFVPPEIREVAEYMAEITYPGFVQQEAERFVNYYTGNGWQVGKAKMKDWKATVRNWKIRHNEQQQSTITGTGKQSPGRTSKHGHSHEELFAAVARQHGFGAMPQDGG